MIFVIFKIFNKQNYLYTLSIDSEITSFSPILFRYIILHKHDIKNNGDCFYLIYNLYKIKEKVCHQLKYYKPDYLMLALTNVKANIKSSVETLKIHMKRV